MIFIRNYMANPLYGFAARLYLARCVLLTRLFYRPARIIRFPFDIRGRRYIRWGRRFTTGRGCRLEAFSKAGDITLHFGDNVQLNDYVHITALQSVYVGNNVLMASRIYISDSAHGDYSGRGQDAHPDEPPAQRLLACKPVVIEDNVWLGDAVAVLPGVTIGRGTVVGANSVVTKSLPPYVVAVGAPAKPIKQYNFTTNKWEKIR
jgi:lipopolysaccharide O-acetyltransferase